MTRTLEPEESAPSAGATSSGLRAVVDQGKCCGYAICVEICPEVYRLDDQGFAVSEGEIAAELELKAREGAEACPELAITIVE